MSWIDPGEFGRGAAAREDARTDHERAVLDQMLGAGWNPATAAEARRLHDATRSAVDHWLARGLGGDCDATALELVGESRGVALADWWARSRGLDDRTARLLSECAAAAAAMAMLDGYLLGRECAEGRVPPSARTVPSPISAAPADSPRLVAGVA